MRDRKYPFTGRSIPDRRFVRVDHRVADGPEDRVRDAGGVSKYTRPVALKDRLRPRRRFSVEPAHRAKSKGE
jgi:hypothetical protein